MTKLSLFLLVSALAAQTNYDLLVQGGRVIDPKNGIDARMDVAIANGKIAREPPYRHWARSLDLIGLIERRAPSRQLGNAAVPCPGLGSPQS